MVTVAGCTGQVSGAGGGAREGQAGAGSCRGGRGRAHQTGFFLPARACVCVRAWPCVRVGVYAGGVQTDACVRLFALRCAMRRWSQMFVRPHQRACASICSGGSASRTGAFVCVYVWCALVRTSQQCKFLTFQQPRPCYGGGCECTCVGQLVACSRVLGERVTCLRACTVFS